jgi:hypothetical protein
MSLSRLNHRLPRAQAQVVYAQRAANSNSLQTGYDQSIYHLSEGAEDAIRPGF